MDQGFDCDVVVIGGGPAGAAAASRLAQIGRSVLVLEGERFPRFHVGESLLPLGEEVFDRIGVRERLAARPFVQKNGAQLLTADGQKRVLFDFADTPGLGLSSTIQVHRAEFDALLLDHAAACGAEVRFERATDVAFSAAGVEVACGERRVRARIAIDASGRAGFVARRRDVREPDPDLRKAAVYAHFRGVPVDPGRRAGDTRIVSTEDLGWFWLIPLDGDVVSVGAVLDIGVWQQHKNGDPERCLAAAIARAPVVAAWMAQAERVSPVHVESSFSYRSTAYCGVHRGERWFLAGDAGSFLDPIFSTGVLMAMQSGVEAADAASAVIAAPARSRSIGRRYDRQQQRRYRFVRRLVTSFYDPWQRDVFFQPRDFFGVPIAVTRVLAGGFSPGWLDRLRLSMFFALGRLQRRFGIVDRVHRVHAEPGAEPDPAGAAVAGAPVAERAEHREPAETP